MSSLDNDTIQYLSHTEAPFVFFKKSGELKAYIMKNKIDQHMTVDILKKVLNPIEDVAVIDCDQPLSVPVLFQALGEPIALIRKNNEIIGYIQREDLLVELLNDENSNINVFRNMLTSIPMGLFIVDRNDRFVNCNETGLKMVRSTYDVVMNKSPGEIFSQQLIDEVFKTGETFLNQIHVTDEFGILVDYSPIIDDYNRIINVLIIVQDLPTVEKLAMDLESVKDLNTDLQAILSSMYDEILVINHHGKILRHSENLLPNTLNLIGRKIIGKNILNIKNEKFISQHVFNRVLKEKKQISIVEEVSNDLTIMSIGNPIFDENNNIHRIVIASRDITETTRLRTELQETKKLTEAYEKELESLRHRSHVSHKIIYVSSEMDKVMRKIEKLSNFSSTVIILGESGVGKELIARAIHQTGLRSNQPFLAINCGAIPDNLLESELFGYVKGAFTGANEEGKEGYFKQANQGILFLDEINELSLSLQVKLLRVLQEREITPIGSTEAIPIDVQIIAATNKNLEELVVEGKFREDLYYRLNVIPIKIPPLRKRQEDIPILAQYFLNQLNETYKTKYHFSPDALNLLCAYSWPGNVRELQHVIERIVVFAEEDLITADYVNSLLNIGRIKKRHPIVTEIMPLKEAQQILEKQLIKLAMDKYKTTTKAAKALGISQSSVSRKYRNILEKA